MILSRVLLAFVVVCLLPAAGVISSSALRSLNAQAAQTLPAPFELAQTTSAFAVYAFSPRGSVRKVRQASARFSKPVVEFGDPRDRKAPFRIRCTGLPDRKNKSLGHGRWTDSRNWTYEFEDPLPGGVRCVFTVSEGLRALDGSSLTGARTFSFDTGGPEILRADPWNGWTRIAADQVFILVLNAPADKTSVEERAAFKVEGLENLVGVEVITGKEEKKILEGTDYSDVEKDQPLLVLRSRLRFPANADVSLIWNRKISTPNGITTGLANDQVFHYGVREAFIVSASCRRKEPTQACDPLGDIRIRFSRFVKADFARQIRLIGPDGSEIKGTPRGQYTRHVVFDAPFRPNKEYQIVLPAELKDIDERAPSNGDQFPLTLSTGDFPPLAKFAAEFGIIEAHHPLLPITVRNLEAGIDPAGLSATGTQRTFLNKVADAINDTLGTSVRLGPDNSGARTDHRQDIITYMQALGDAGFNSSKSREKSILGAYEDREKTKTFPLPPAAGKNKTEIVGIDLEKPGFHVVEIASRNLAKEFLQHPKVKGSEKKEFMYVRSAALVTNLAAHLKLGRESSLVWVTRLNDAEPVSNARVFVHDCSGTQLAQGKTNADGVVIFDEDLQPFPAKRCGNHYRSYQRGLFVFAEKGDDITFVHTSWNKGIRGWRFGLAHHTPKNEVPYFAHAVLDRGLYRAGETVSMKHFVRKHTGHGLRYPEKYAPWRNLILAHQGTNQRYVVDLSWDEHGTADSRWTIPENANLGTYSLYYAKDPEAKSWNSHYAGELQVQEFKVPLTKGLIKAPTGALVNAGKIPLDLAVTYLAGGGAANMPVTLRTEITERSDYFDSRAFPDFVYNAGAALPKQSEKTRLLRKTAFKLDANGTARHVVDDLPENENGLSVLSEMEYRDPNGEIRTAVKRVTIAPSPSNIGVLTNSWIGKDDPLGLKVMVRTLDDKPAESKAVTVRLYRQEHISHRKKLAGGTYAYEHETKWVPLGEFCRGKTDENGLLVCDKPAGASGNIFAEAEITDDSGRKRITHTDAWIMGEEPWWFDASDSDRIDILAKTKDLEPGDTARLQVRTPFRESTALITIEREGVIDYRLTRLSGMDTIVDVPMKDTYAPNIYVSVMTVRGRVAAIKPTAMIDLGKPAYKLGYAELRVGWRKHRLNVSVEPEKTVYQVMEKARVGIKVEAADDTPIPKEAEVAIAAVDEGLLLLAENQSWGLLRAMMGLRGNEVKTATAQMQVVGKRHFGQKAVPDGGGGGEAQTTVRENFETLLLWKGRVQLDEHGEAKVDIPLNDSLTRFRIVAVASAGPEKFGTGHASIRATKDLLVFSGIAPMVREKDDIVSTFTLRNTTERPMRLSSTLRVDGLEQSLPPRRLELEAGQSAAISWRFTIPVDASSLTYTLETREDGTLVDALKTTQPVKAAVAVRTLQGDFAQLTEPFSLTAKRPHDAIPGRGGLKVLFSRSLVCSLYGVKDYMRRYPYSCFEQETSRAISLDDRHQWDELMESMPSYLDSNGLIKYWPTMDRGSVILSSYVLSIAHERGWAIPPDTRRAVIDGLRAFFEGRLAGYTPSWAKRYRLPMRLTALAALSRYDAPTSQHLESLRVNPNSLSTSALLDWLNIVHRITGISQHKNLRANARRILLSRLRFDGRVIRFTRGNADDIPYFMTGRQVNANRIVLSLLEFGLMKEDIPRFMKASIARQLNGHWGQTTANAFGTVAVMKFAARYEHQEVRGTSTATFRDNKAVQSWAPNENQTPILLPWPDDKPEELSVNHDGEGAPWVTVYSQAAVPFKKPFSSGFSVKKTISPVRQKKPGRWTDGDVVRVRLTVDARSTATWVVIDDPVPAGATILGKGLGGQSRLAVQDEKSASGALPVFEERAHDAMRIYYDYVGEGTFSYEYTYRLNAAGRFNLPETRVEAMYDPDLFGLRPNGTIEVARDAEQ